MSGGEKWSQFPEAGPILGNEILALIQGGLNVQTAVNQLVSAYIIGQALYPQTNAERIVGFTPSQAQQKYPPLYARRYGVVFDGVTDDTPAWQVAIQVGLSTVNEWSTIYTGGANIIGDYGVSRIATGPILLASNVGITGPNLPTGQGSTFSATMLPGCMVFYDANPTINSKLFDTAPFVTTQAINGGTGTSAPVTATLTGITQASSR